MSRRIKEYRRKLVRERFNAEERRIAAERCEEDRKVAAGIITYTDVFEVQRAKNDAARAEENMKAATGLLDAVKLVGADQQEVHRRATDVLTAERLLVARLEAKLAAVRRVKIKELAHELNESRRRRVEAIGVVRSVINLASMYL
jgi:hypothetical protein